MDLRVQRRHKKREGKVERDTARVFYMRLSPVRLKIQFNSSTLSDLVLFYLMFYLCIQFTLPLLSLSLVFYLRYTKIHTFRLRAADRQQLAQSLEGLSLDCPSYNFAPPTA